MFKKSGLLLSCSNSHPFYPSGQASSTSPSPAACQNQQRRRNAIVSDGHSKHNHGNLRWPELTSTNTIPTPYQIFNQRRGSPYSKHRFYELVKLYHPDRHDHFSNEGLLYTTKLERYRLVIAANDILSDPIKRGAYDCYGAGWNGQPDAMGYRDASDSSWAHHGGKGWGGGPGSPSQNATWEDWERWYQRDAKGQQEPRYTSNSAFVSLIVIFAALGGIGQATRVGNYSMTFIEQRDALHDKVSKDLIRRRNETNAFGNREERIQDFLRQRDPVGYGVTDAHGENHRKLLPPDICSSEDVKERRMDSNLPQTKSKDG